jgi:drug/metabolite transporter (DMT)-like permease
LGVLFGAGFVLQSMGLTETPATTSAFITGTTVVFVPFVYRIVEHRPVSIVNWLSTFAVAVGLFLFTAPEQTGFRLGDVLTLFSAVGWACYIVALDVLTVSYADHQGKRDLLVLMQFLVTTAVGALGVLLVDRAVLQISWTSDVVWALLYCGLAATVITTWLQTNVQRHTHPVRAGVIFSLEPIFAGIIAIVAFDEQWGLRQGAGALVLIAAIVLPDLITMKQLKK